MSYVQQIQSQQYIRLISFDPFWSNFTINISYLYYCFLSGWLNLLEFYHFIFISKKCANLLFILSIFLILFSWKRSEKVEMIFSSRCFLQKTNELYFTTMKPQVDLFSFVFWRKLKTAKRHFEIIWPLTSSGRKSCKNGMAMVEVEVYLVDSGAH